MASIFTEEDVYKRQAMSRPVETLLCGPAASIIGAMELSKYQDALIVDMGGTTSDVAMVKDGIPVTSESGISIGEWKTMVKGVSIDTFALGGDSAVKYKRGQLYLDNRRCVPLCMAASQYPKMRKALKTLVLIDVYKRQALLTWRAAAAIGQRTATVCASRYCTKSWTTSSDSATTCASAAAGATISARNTSLFREQ